MTPAARRDTRDWSSRLLDRYEVAASGCWEWTGYKANGYGRLTVGRQCWLAHRLSYALHYGDLPADSLICHHCDNPACINPEHLYAGDIVTNVADRTRRGRHVATLGERSGNTELTADDITELRARYAAGGISQLALARHYGISQSEAWNIIHRRRWRHVA